MDMACHRDEARSESSLDVACHANPHEVGHEIDMARRVNFACRAVGAYSVKHRLVIGMTF